jgi:hypothetical protein
VTRGAGADALVLASDAGALAEIEGAGVVASGAGAALDEGVTIGATGAASMGASTTRCGAMNATSAAV